MPQSAKDCGDGARPVVESSVSTRHTPAQKDTPVRRGVVALMVAAGPFVVTPFRAEDRKSTKTSSRRRPKRKTAASDTGAEWCPAPSGKPVRQKLNT